MVAVSVRVDEETVRRLQDLSEATNRPKSFLINEAIKAYLDEYADYRMALDRLLDKDDDIIGSQDMRKRLGI